jgi:tRNA nucleotidyltransferase (CCA-adding enzyme)
MSKIEENVKLLESGQSLTSRESEVFKFIFEVCETFVPFVIARVAGGWVRDKLLGRPSDDLDIAVEHCTSMEFAVRLREKWQKGEAKIIVMEANPEQAKHLETARICLFSDFWIDICGLRSDSYAQERNNADTAIRTPQIDASRRDFTINALFFNLKKRKVEDFTSGIQDMERAILRTPLAPEITFRDDPLRILRGIRFSCRFDFALDPGILSVAKDILPHFHSKITRERISAELVKCLETTCPEKCIELIHEYSLFNSIFDHDCELNLNESEAMNRVRIVTSRNIRERPLVLTFAAIYAPLYGLKGHDRERGNRLFDLLEIVIVRKHRISNRIADEVMALLRGAELLSNIERPLNRLHAGQWVRSVGQLWKFVHFLLFDEELYRFCLDEVFPLIHNEHLEDVWELKPLLNGIELAEVYGVKPGKGLKDLTENLLIWQIENPYATAEDYRAYVRSSR